MTKFKTNIEWLDKLLPEGVEVPSSTLISGPGGTGKPLVEFAFVSAWLKAGGTLIAVPLQYPSADLMKIAMNKLYKIDLRNYQGKVVYIQFDPRADKCDRIRENTLCADMVKPDIWDEAITRAEEMLEESDLGTMVFGSALNLLLFSPNYQESILKKLKEIIKNDKSKTYAFAVSTTVFANQIKMLEEAADNLMYTRIEEPMRLFFRIFRMKDVQFSNEEAEVPISKQMLKEIKKVAEATRKLRIPEIRGTNFNFNARRDLAMNEVSLNYQQMEWTEAMGYPSGTKMKMLREEGSEKTFLLKLPAGFDMKDHSHMAAEQHFVLQGEYESGGQKYGPGTYRFIPSKVTHGPFTSKNGAEVLVIWEAL